MKNAMLMLLVVSLAACGGGGGGSAGPTNGDESETFAITANAGEGGQITPASAEVDDGGSQSFTIETDDGYSIDSVTGCDGTLDGNVYEVSNVNSSCDIVVRFTFCEDCFTRSEFVASEYMPAAPVMARVCKRGPLYVTGSKAVRWDALCAAGDMLDAMLANRQDVVLTLQAAGAMTTVFAESENVCDTDYFAYLSGQSICEDAAGGLGGVVGNPVTACSERNVLALASDPYRRGLPEGENTCVHELAHTIMNVGLDQPLRDEIKARYDDVIAHTDLWKRADGSDAFARQNDHEFWAEITQSYFSANPEVDSFLHNGVNSAKELKDHDPVSYEIVDRVFVEPADLR